MNRVVSLGVVVLVGCQAAPKLVEPFPEPSRASGSWVVLEDRRPAWEKAAFEGPVVSLYRFSRVSPNPWVRLQKATEAIVADLPEKPERVDVVVTSFRLVSKNADAPPRTEEGGTVQVGGRKASVLGTGRQGVDESMAYERARSAATSGDRNVAQQAAGALAFQGGAPAAGVQLGEAPAVELTEGPLDGLAPGAHCNIRGVLRLTYPGGRDKDVPFHVLASRPNETGSRYWGETLEQATTLGMIQFARQVRLGLGLPARE
ncbi:hypothetical protein [Urbifossiella limnaea]|uniref:Lipoprotein n=1 Tax=Urbifossiella limnaea TaxID=2528023 RepID=A0A517XSQ4_9BACT|nr:hypothetical protein [Urbifossiella limnaea]QDU20539.1 hypothetical protein ETAA1_24930 [Urbifossiella limnaea]